VLEAELPEQHGQADVLAVGAVPDAHPAPARLASSIVQRRSAAGTPREDEPAGRSLGPAHSEILASMLPTAKMRSRRSDAEMAAPVRRFRALATNTK